MPHATCTGRRDIRAAYLDVRWNLTRFRGCWDRIRDGSWNLSEISRTATVPLTASAVIVREEVRCLIERLHFRDYHT